MNLGDRVRIAGRVYIVDDEAFISARPEEYRSLSWREVNAAKVAADNERWCSICKAYVTKDSHNTNAHDENDKDREKAKDRKASGIRYERITIAGQRPFWLCIKEESDQFLTGIEVKINGDEVTGRGFDERLRVIHKEMIAKRVPAVMNGLYGELEVESRRASTEEMCAECGERRAEEGREYCQRCEEALEWADRDAEAYERQVDQAVEDGYLRSAGVTDNADGLNGLIEGVEPDDVSRPARPIVDFELMATRSVTGHWNWEVRAGEVIVADGLASTKRAAYAAARNAARYATNWTLDGMPIMNGFDVVATDDDPTGTPCYFCGRRKAGRDLVVADAYNSGDGGYICASCVDEHDSLVRTAKTVQQRERDNKKALQRLLTIPADLRGTCDKCGEFDDLYLLPDPGGYGDVPPPGYGAFAYCARCCVRVGYSG